MEILLVRQYFEQGTNGELFICGKKFGYTIELPWKNNQRRVSCIPEGRYKIRKRYTPRFGWHILVENVKGRDGILIHAFNDALKESKGCIAPVTTITGQGKGRASRLALNRLLSIVNRLFETTGTIFLNIKKQDYGLNNSESKTADTEVL